MCSKVRREKFSLCFSLIFRKVFHWGIPNLKSSQDHDHSKSTKIEAILNVLIINFTNELVAP